MWKQIICADRMHGEMKQNRKHSSFAMSRMLCVHVHGENCEQN